ncbi:hypothetical protein HDU93_006840 [Gonapodya sp. JEL0774]|nr:hypothetical protein HDU93_006840 [Gonapodya sp. JEL0774]
MDLPFPPDSPSPPSPSAPDLSYGRRFVPFNIAERSLHFPPYHTDHHWAKNTVPLAASDLTGWVYWQSWSRIGSVPKADILYIHGIKDYSGRQPNRGLRAILDAGYRVHAIDLPGHGRSDGIHALFTMQELLHAVANAAALIVNPEVLPPPWIVSLGTLLLTTFPSLAPLPYAEANNGKSTSNPDAQRLFDDDPMAYTGKIRLGTGMALLDAFALVARGMSTSTGTDTEPLPVGPRDPSAHLRVLYLHGDADRVAAVSSAHAAYAAGAGAFVGDPDRANKVRVDREKIVYTGGVQHDLPAEWIAERMIDDVVGWLDARV